MAEDDVFRLRIKSFKDVEISVPAGSVVAHVKQQVKAALAVDESEEERYLRLICKGRLLLPDDHPIRDFNVCDGDVVHAVLAPVGFKSPSSSSGQATNNTSRRRHRNGTVVGPGGRVTRAANAAGDSDSDSSDDGDLEAGQHRERRGFDRLRASGLRRTEISAIRAYFSRHVERYIAAHPNEHSDERDGVRRRHLYEEDWMAQQGPTSEFQLNLNQNTLLRFAGAFNNNTPGLSTTTNGAFRTSAVGTDRDFMWGFMLGFFVGFVMLVWVWMPTVPHKQKIGILAGISFQLATAVLRDPQQPDEFDEGD